MKKINFNAPINHTGYGIASLNILKNLVKKFDVSYFPIGNIGVSNQEEFNIVKTAFDNSTIFDINAPCIKIWHQFDLASHIGRGPYYGYPFFELDTFNDKEKIHLSVPDEIFVSCEWAKEVVINNGIKNPVNVVPLGVDTSIFDWNSYSFNNISKNDSYIFLTIGKWEVRKCHDILPYIFKQAFPEEKDVELWILAAEHTNGYSSADDLKKWKELYSTDNRIKLIPGVESHKDIAKIISISDCGLYISRAEGWNLELLETMAMNRPAIASSYSAHTEFCNKDNSYLVDITNTEKAFDGKAFSGQGNWAQIGQSQIDQTIDYMRYVYKNRINTNPNGVNTAKKYSWANSVECLSRCIN